MVSNDEDWFPTKNGHDLETGENTERHSLLDPGQASNSTAKTLLSNTFAAASFSMVRSTGVHVSQIVRMQLAAADEERDAELHPG